MTIETRAALEALLFGTRLDTLAATLNRDSRTAALWSVITAHFMDSRITLTTAAHAVGATPNNLNSLLKHVDPGHTFFELLTSYRLYRSIELLEKHNYSFMEAGRACGYHDASSYCRAFRKRFAAPPSTALPRASDYRRRLNLGIVLKALKAHGVAEAHPQAIAASARRTPNRQPV